MWLLFWIKRQLWLNPIQENFTPIKGCLNRGWPHFFGFGGGFQRANFYQHADLRFNSPELESTKCLHFSQTTECRFDQLSRSSKLVDGTSTFNKGHHVQDYHARLPSSAVQRFVGRYQQNDGLVAIGFLRK